jgi:hypothetical protein
MKNALTDKKRMRGQISTELIVVIGMTLLIFTPILVTVYFKGVETSERLAAAQARLTVTRMASLADSIGNLGENASIVVDIFIPKDVIMMKFGNAKAGSGGAITIRLNTTEGIHEISEPVAFKFAEEKNFSGLVKGMMRLSISSNGEKLVVERVG